MDANGAISFSKLHHVAHVDQSTKALPNKVIRCPWPLCSATVDVNNELGSIAHIQDHQQVSLRWKIRWPGATRCSWPKCSSKATFKTPSSLKTYLINIHAAPLVCSQLDCSYAGPFSKKHDLDRHMSTVHGESRDFKCPVEDCQADFSRKDKLKKHIREQHGSLMCPYNHCSTTVLANEKEEHLQVTHGPYECMLKSCQDCLVLSRFTKVGLGRHLRKNHAVNYGLFGGDLLFRLRNTDDKIARQSHLGGSKARVLDCSSCAVRCPVQNPTQASIINKQQGNTMSEPNAVTDVAT
jgi:hypothetical protein